MKSTQGGKKLVTQNRKALHLYFIEDKIESGIELQGTEVKSIRMGKVNLSDSYCKVMNDEIFIYNMNISPYDCGGYCNHDPIRRRRLLLHHREIIKLRTKLTIRGYTLIPLSIYFKRGWLKLDLGLARGKKKADKREEIKKREGRSEIKDYR